MTPTIHPAGPTARVITLPKDRDRFTVPNPKRDGDRDRVLITTITIDGFHVSLQGQALAGSSDAGQFHDLTAVMSPSEATAEIMLRAPAGTISVFEQALTELRHPAGKSSTTQAPRVTAAATASPGPGTVTSLERYRQRTGRR